MKTRYDQRYNQEQYYWGVQPSLICFEVLKRKPPEQQTRLLDIGCGEGHNAVFFARNGYDVTAFDYSEKGVEKTLALAEHAGIKVKAFVADLNDYFLDESYDVIFSVGALHYLAEKKRLEIIANYKQHTFIGGLNAFSVLLNKPFIERAPDCEESARLWRSGEVFTFYHDWQIDFCQEEIFDCMSSGVPHKHAVNRMVAKKFG